MLGVCSEDGPITAQCSSNMLHFGVWNQTNLCYSIATEDCCVRMAWQKEGVFARCCQYHQLALPFTRFKSGLQH